METEYLLPLTVFALVLAVAALGFRANRRRGYGPLVLGLAAAGFMLVGRFVIDSNVAVYGSVVTLVVASLWNAWPTSVPAAPSGTLYQVGSIKKEQ